MRKLMNNLLIATVKPVLENWYIPYLKDERKRIMESKRLTENIRRMIKMSKELGVDL